MRVRKKGIIILPKKLRELIGLDEGSEVLVEVMNGKLVLTPLKPKVVDVDPSLVERLLREEYVSEERKYERMFRGEENGSRY